MKTVAKVTKMTPRFTCSSGSSVLSQYRDVRHYRASSLWRAAIGLVEAEVRVKDSFSRRHDFSQVDEAEITVREDAPQALQEHLILLSYECGLKPSGLRQIIC